MGKTNSRYPQCRNCIQCILYFRNRIIDHHVLLNTLKSIGILTKSRKANRVNAATLYPFCIIAIIHHLWCYSVKGRVNSSCKVCTSSFTLGLCDPPVSPGFLHRQESLQSPDMATQDFLHGQTSVECMWMRLDLKKLQWDKTRQTNWELV